MFKNFKVRFYEAPFREATILKQPQPFFRVLDYFLLVKPLEGSLLRIQRVNRSVIIGVLYHCAGILYAYSHVQTM